jgi:hypothetical protein
MASAQYRYKSLSDECFRLFRIQSTESDRIEIHLFEAEFKSPPAFEAVSYAWGENHTTSIILCNGQHLSISLNVEAILRRLRQRVSAGTFWIDSICINQASILERNIQVPRMRSIYSDARLVWIWLGEGIDEIKIAFNFLLEVSAMIEKGQVRPADDFVSPQILKLHEEFTRRNIQCQRVSRLC